MAELGVTDPTSHAAGQNGVSGPVSSEFYHHHHTPLDMIAPITGKLRKRLWLDLSVGIGLGVSSAYAFW